MTKIVGVIPVCLALAGCGGGDVPPVPMPDESDAVQLLIALHNEYRAQHNLPPLVQNPMLQAAADKHSAYQAKVGRMAHFGIGDGAPGGRITAEGYAWNSYGENVAWNQATPADVMKAWMRSPGHRWNILGAYKEIGASVARGPKGDPYWTTDFGTTGASMFSAGPMPAEVSPDLLPPVSEAK